MKKVNITVGEWSEVWLREYAEPIYAPKTTKCYKEAFSRLFRMSPQIEKKNLQSLTQRECQRVIFSFSREYAKSSLNHIRAALSKLYQSAIDNGYCTINPASNLKLPRAASEKTVNALTAKEEEIIRKYLPQDMYRNIIEFFLLTGLRNGELRNLQWEDFDNTTGILYVKKSKTKAGIRAVPLIPEALLIIAHQKIITKGNGFIFQQIQGGQLTETVMRRTMERVRRNTGVENFTIHVLRHTFASRMVERKADYKALSKILGHTSVAFTLQRYVSLETDFLKKNIMLLSQSGT